MVPMTVSPQLSDRDQEFPTLANPWQQQFVNFQVFLPECQRSLHATVFHNNQKNRLKDVVKRI